jgi:hypothetical protein
MSLLNEFIGSEILGAILQSIIGAIFVISVAAIGRVINNRPIKRVWGLILGDANGNKWYNFIFRQRINNKLYVVLPTIDPLQLGGFEKTTWHETPKNINLILLQEALGISELIKALSKVYGDLDVELCAAHDFHDYKSNFISIGGPSVNSVTKNGSGRLSNGVVYCLPDISEKGMTRWSPSRSPAGIAAVQTSQNTVLPRMASRSTSVGPAAGKVETILAQRHIQRNSEKRSFVPIKSAVACAD